MRRLFLLGLCGFALSGCAFQEWDRMPFFSGNDPYAPQGQSENMRRSRGQTVAIEPLAQQSGNIWPGPLPPVRTLEDFVKQEQSGRLPAQTLPGQPAAPPVPPPQSGGAIPPTVQPVVPQIPPVPNVGAPPTPPAPPATGSGVVQTPEGPAVTSGGTGAFKTVTMPNGLTGIVVPNGNGTSTIILSNGQVQTVPDHK
jgi:hypothetical protein